jgi:hypothetical protein
MMSGFVSGSQFGMKAGIRVAIFAGLTLGFPFIVYGLIVATGARSVGGASGALAAVAGVYLKPIILLGFLISLIGPCWRRMRSLDLPAVWGLLVPLLFLMDALYLVVIGTHWGTAFSLGIMKVNLPVFALVALVMLVTMALAMPPSDDVASGNVFRRLSVVSAILAVLLIAIALMSSGLIWLMLAAAFNPKGIHSVVLWLMKVGYYPQLLKPFVCAAFCMAIACMAILSRQNRSGSASDGGQPGGDPFTRSPPPSPMNAGGVAFGRR